MRSAVLLLTLLGACQPVTLPDLVARYEPDGAGFFDTPWPSDARATPDGAPDWSRFPNPTGLTLFQTFLARASTGVGTATNAPAYLTFDTLPDEALLPTPEGSLDPTSTVQLVDITPSSPTFGQRTPVWWELRDAPGAYVVENLLAVAPLPGWPLRPRTTYALLVTTDLAAPSRAFEADWEDVEGPFAGLRAALGDLGLTPEQVAVATTFTTSDPMAQLDGIARFLRERVEPPTFTQELEPIYDIGAFSAWRSNYTTPLFMHGDKPYAESGGAFVFRDDGLPEIASWDLMRMSVVVPRDQAPPPGGWPVLVYLHGTGGDYRNFANSSSEFEVGNWAAQLGIVGIGIDLPLHGPRGTPDTAIELHSFNVLQPDSALHIHRQGAADLMYLLDGLTQGVTFTTPDGSSITLDGDRIAVMGHSQGGITASLALPWIGDQVRGVMLSGAGGLLAITAVERDADIDFPTLIRSLLQFEDGEELTELHPVLGLVQSLVEPTDPINYAPSWFHEDGGLSVGGPTSVLLTTGLQDAQTPTRTSEALASAARLPSAGRRRGKAEALALRGLPVERLPLSDNVEAWNGATLTAGFSQWPEGDHFVVFDDPEARDLARNFVSSALGRGAEIRSGPPEAPDR